jgi:hypothetical protein
MMVEIVKDFDNGIVVEGWEPKDLAASINSLSAERLTELKESSHRAAQVLSAETERATFFATIGERP